MSELKEFEDSLMELVKHVEYDRHTNEFLKKLDKDTKQIGEEDRLIIAADKTTNLCKMQPQSYNKLLKEAVQKDYKKSKPNFVSKIIKEDKVVATESDIEDRVQKVRCSEAFITLKDHKENFENNPKVRLINPTKSEVGRISKKILENVNCVVKEKTKLRLWRNTDEVITWFSNIEEKDQYVFIEFDVVEFYPSISEQLLTNALKWANNYISISEYDMKVVMQAKRSLLFSKGEIWTKKGDPFDVPMGSYDGAESCELVGLFMLHQMEELQKEAGLYRDDGLMICRGTPREVENVKKAICDLYQFKKKNNLRITCEANKKCVKYLDVFLNLSTCCLVVFFGTWTNVLHIFISQNLFF